MKNKIIFLILFLFLFVILNINFKNYQLAITNYKKKYEVIGRVEKIAPSQNKNLITINKSIPIKDRKILITPGKVRHNSYSNYIKISKIKSPKIYTTSDKYGEFKLKLIPGEYTFFLVINDMAYLNSFDKYGNFTSRSIYSRINDLIITDFRDSSF